MKTTLIRIGNSRGVRIPKPIIEQCELTNEVELEVLSGKIVIHSADKPRKGWNDAFRKMALHGDDTLLDRPLPNVWEDKDWEWK